MTSAPLISDLPDMVAAEGWEWNPFETPMSSGSGFWLGTDTQGRRWLAKLRGRDSGLRELAFARAAQRLGWSCQSSMFESLPASSRVRRECKDVDPVQLVHWYYEEADYSDPVVKALLAPIQEGLNDPRRHPLDAVTNAPIISFIDWPRSEIAACLFGANETCGRLLTTALANVIIDSELMFASMPDLSLDTSWLHADAKTGQAKGLALSLEVCESVASLSANALEAFAKPPRGVRVQLRQPIEPVMRAAAIGAERILRTGHPDFCEQPAEWA